MASQTDLIYVRRDQDGKIIEVSLQPEKGLEPCMASSEQSPTPQNEKSVNKRDFLFLSDLSTVRVLEDVIDLLISKDLITFTELPEVAQKKLLERRSVRTEIKGLDLLGDEQDEII